MFSTKSNFYSNIFTYHICLISEENFVFFCFLITIGKDTKHPGHQDTRYLEQRLQGEVCLARGIKGFDGRCSVRTMDNVTWHFRKS